MFRIGSIVVKALAKLLTTPRIWLIAAAIFFCAWVGFGYHQDQLAAELALEGKTGVAPPESTVSPDLSGWRQITLAVAVLLSLVAAVFHIRSSAPKDQKPDRSNYDVITIEEAPGAFQPILTQEEIVGQSPNANSDKTFGASSSPNVAKFMQTAVHSLKPIKSRR